MKRFIIDGSTSPDKKTSLFHAYQKGFADYPPFAVFDPETQDNIIISDSLACCRLIALFKNVSHWLTKERL